jgi:SCP-2 sterol transfer family
MGDQTDDFFERLDGIDERGYFMGQSGSIRFDIRDGGRLRHWRVRSDKGRLTVDSAAGDADCVLSTDIATMEAIVAGRQNAMAALLRGALTSHGRTALLVGFQKLFPGPPTDAKRQVAGYARRGS